MVDPHTGGVREGTPHTQEFGSLPKVNTSSCLSPCCPHSWGLNCPLTLCPREEEGLARGWASGHSHQPCMGCPLVALGRSWPNPAALALQPLLLLILHWVLDICCPLMRSPALAVRCQCPRHVCPVQTCPSAPSKDPKSVSRETLTQQDMISQPLCV